MKVNTRVSAALSPHDIAIIRDLLCIMDSNELIPQHAVPLAEQFFSIPSSFLPPIITEPSFYGQSPEEIRERNKELALAVRQVWPRMTIYGIRAELSLKGLTREQIDMALIDANIT